MQNELKKKNGNKHKEMCFAIYSRIFQDLETKAIILSYNIESSKLFI